MGIIRTLYRNKSVKWFWLISLIAVPVILWILPGDFLDNSETIICPSKRFFDIECLGCGMSRAVLHLHNFQFQDAIFYNYAVLIVYPLLVFVWAKWFISALRDLDLIKRKS